MADRIDRRSFLRIGAGAVTAASTGLWLDRTFARASTGSPTFAHGVASGDPTSSSVLLWTRLSGAAATVPVAWELATDPAFQQIVGTGTAVAEPSRDHVVHVDAGGLAPATAYWYRFRTDGGESMVGRTRTLPEPGQHAGTLKIGVITCAELEWGWFGAYRHLAARDDIDLVLCLGDYLYEYASGDYGGAFPPGPGIGREVDPPWETLTLSDYRRRHASYRVDPDLQALHARHPVIAVWDDHEICNDAWREGGENHTAATEGDYAARFAAARQAYLEWLPVRSPDSTDPLRVHRSVQVGDLAEFWLLDERTYRDRHAQAAFLTLGSVDPAVDDPNRSILGTAQREWLIDGLTSSTAAWKVVGNQVPFTPYRIGPDVTSPVRRMLAEHGATLPVRHPIFETDTWTGYSVEQRTIAAAMGNVDDVVVLTGDAHASYANEVPVDPDTYAFDRAAAAVEFIAPSITSPSLSKVIESRGLMGADNLEHVLAANNRTANPWIRYYEGRASGYGVLDLSHEQARYEFWHLMDPMDATEVPKLAAAFATPRGTSRIDPA